MCGRLVNLDTVARVLADYYHIKTDTQLAALDEALSKVPAVSVGGSHEKDHIADQWERDVDALMQLPSAQQEIVACGDCIHWICHDRRCGYWNHGVKPLDWCCHAERRTNG